MTKGRISLGIRYLVDTNFVRPMECLEVDQIPEGKLWQYELKLKGYRTVAIKQNGCIYWPQPGKAFLARPPANRALCVHMNMLAPLRRLWARISRRLSGKLQQMELNLWTRRTRR
jgi:hypothetical protein